MRESSQPSGFPAQPLLGSAGGALRGGPRGYLNHTFSSAFTFQHNSHTLKGGGLVALEEVTSNLVEKTTQGSFSFQSGGGFTAFQNFLRGNSGGACGERCSYRETDTDVINRFPSRRYRHSFRTRRIRSKATLDLGFVMPYPLTPTRTIVSTFSPEAYDPAQAPTFADPDAFYVVAGTGNPLNGHAAGKNCMDGMFMPDKNNLQPRTSI
jgi:hypothetical protein